MTSDELLSPATAAAYPAWYDGAVNDWPWYEVTLAVVIMAAIFVFTSICISHIAAAWTLRKDFKMAARSPVLLTLSGSAGVLLSSVLMCRITLFPGEAAKSLEGSGPEIVLVPLSTTAFTAVYGLRGLRLLIMYDRHMRQRWGGVPDEGAMVKVWLVCYLVIEVTAWSASLICGVSRVASLTFVVVIVETLLTLGICSTLVGKLRKTHDIFCMSFEMQKVGASALVVLVMAIFLLVGPTALQRHWLIATVIVRFCTPLWLSNIQPVRVILEERAGYSRSGIFSLFPYLPWEASSKVAVEARFRLSSPVGSRGTTRSFKLDPELDKILNCPPLLKAFGAYCQRALCSESLEFLVAGKIFVASLKTSSAADGDGQLHDFRMIVDKYIARYSPFEVNIDNQVKEDIFAKVATFKELSLGGKIHILDAARKEVGHLLQENLLENFKATKQYREINAAVWSSSPG